MGKRMRKAWQLSLGALVLALAAILVPAIPAPTATASAAPWTWVRVVDQINVEPHSFYSIREFCPVGYTAISGGLLLPQFSQVFKNAEHPFTDELGSSWFVAFENSSDSSGTASVVAECVETSDLPGLSHNFAAFATGSDGRASGTLPCLNPGEIAVMGGVSWSNVNTRSISANGPMAFGEGWHAAGFNSVDGAEMTMEVWCTHPSQLPFYTRVEHTQQGEGFWKSTITCPQGWRILNGGTSGARSNASYPSLNTWTATGASSQPTVIRAYCVEAGSPTVQLTHTSPGPPGSVTNQTTASFGFTGTDPAGFRNGFQCSLDGEAPRLCFSGNPYEGLASGPHQFVIFNETADGRRSGILTYNWTVDATAPTVTPPNIATISRVNPVRVTWKATDDQTGVALYEAAIWRARADGTVTDWAQPSGRDNLATPSVRLPALAAGETICVSVRARDGVGNDAPWTAPRCTSRPFDDRAMAATTTGWNRVTGTQYWLETATNTGAANQTLRRLNAHVTRVGVLATVCPSCGIVELSAGGTRVGRINLERAAVAHQKILVLTAFALRSGNLTVTSVTSGKSVRIDGVITIRTTDTVPPP